MKTFYRLFMQKLLQPEFPRSVRALDTCLFHLWRSYGVALPSHCPCSSVMEPCKAGLLPSSVVFLSVPHTPAVEAITPLPLVSIKMPSS